MTHLEKLDYIPQNIDLMAGMDITGNIKHLLRDIAYIAAGPLFSGIGTK